MAEKTGKAEELNGTRLKGRDRVSGTTFSEPGIYRQDGVSVWRTTVERNGKGRG